jgi:hypothetical protein
MKKFGVLLVIFLVISATDSFCFSNHKPVTNTAQFEALSNLSVNQFIHLSAGQFGMLTNKKMNLWDRFSFNLMKLKLKHELKKDPSLTLKTFAAESKAKHRLGVGVWILIGIVGLLLILLLAFAITVGKWG